ncbi:hypothetical protein N9064_00725 [bacterium]|nr:hypothetical protein [bacterium]
MAKAKFNKQRRFKSPKRGRRILLYILTLLLTNHITKDYERNKHYKSKLSGYSINDKIKSGEQFVWETYTPYEKLTQGDLVLFRNNQGGITMHQLREQQGDNWVTQGSNNRFRDSLVVGKNRFLGKFKQKVEK